jgi:hypothetical protein
MAFDSSILPSKELQPGRRDGLAAPMKGSLDTAPDSSMSHFSSSSSSVSSFKSNKPSDYPGQVMIDLDEFERMYTAPKLDSPTSATVMKLSWNACHALGCLFDALQGELLANLLAKIQLISSTSSVTSTSSPSLHITGPNLLSTTTTTTTTSTVPLSTSTVVALSKSAKKNKKKRNKKKEIKKAAVRKDEDEDGEEHDDEEDDDVDDNEIEHVRNEAVGGVQVDQGRSSRKTTIKTTTNSAELKIGNRNFLSQIDSHGSGAGNPELLQMMKWKQLHKERKIGSLLLWFDPSLDALISAIINSESYKIKLHATAALQRLKTG